MTGLLSADRCPTCTRVHGQPTDWPQCPDHGHLLYQLRVDDAGWTYTCPAHRCKYTHTQPGRATMTTANEHAAGALAIRPEQELFTDKQKAALAQLGISGASNADLAVFMHYCQRTGLDPFSRQIYMIGRRTKQDGEWVTRQTIQVGIDGYRLIARKAAEREGVSIAYGNTIWYDANGQPSEVWVHPVPPAAAAVIVYRDGKPFPGTARFAAFAAVTKDGQLMGQWATMPDHMIAKCAEAQALRKAFPQDLGGITTDDENAHIGNPRPNLTASPYAEPLPEPLPRRKPAPQDPEMVKAAIVRQFDRLDIDTDTDERDIITCRLVGADTVHQLTDGQFEMVLSTLESCDDRTHLDEILDGDPGF